MSTNIRVRVKDLIPTAKFANTEIEFEVEREVHDDEIPQEALDTTYKQVEVVLKAKRNEVCKELGIDVDD